VAHEQGLFLAIPQSAACDKSDINGISEIMFRGDQGREMVSVHIVRKSFLHLPDKRKCEEWLLKLIRDTSINALDCGKFEKSCVSATGALLQSNPHNYATY
jgi:hypothetical protein